MSAIEIIAIVVVCCIIASFPILFNLFGNEDRCGHTNWERLVAWFKNKFRKDNK